MVTPWEPGQSINPWAFNSPYTMVHDVTDDEELSEYECLECGTIVESASHPGDCEECGGTVQNRGMSLE